MQRSITILVVIGVALVLGYLVWSSTHLVQAECEVCVEFRGQRECRRGTGPTQEEARDAGQKAACGLMAPGMDASIACSRTIPKTVQCTGP